MAKADIAAVLALLAALFIAISDVVQQRLAYDVTDERVGAIALFSRLLRNPRWWLGSLVAAVGFALQAAALGLGSVFARFRAVPRWSGGAFDGEQTRRRGGAMSADCYQVRLRFGDI